LATINRLSINIHVTKKSRTVVDPVKFLGRCGARPLRMEDMADARICHSPSVTLLNLVVLHPTVQT